MLRTIITICTLLLLHSHRSSPWPIGLDTEDCSYLFYLTYQGRIRGLLTVIGGVCILHFVVD